MFVLGRLALLFIVFPIVELVLLIQLGRVVGVLPTVLLVLGTGLGGAMLARAEGLRVLFQFQRELASGRLPGQSMLDGIAVLVGGALLLTPGVLTDLLGLSLLFPPTRRWIQGRVRARLERQVADGTIRVVAMGSGPMGGFGYGVTGLGGFDRSREPGAEAARPGEWKRADAVDDVRPLDPRKAIVVEPKDD
jgi:UPF0716 protein FxsA